MTSGEHHYALDAAVLIDVCRRRLRAIIESDYHIHPNLNDLDCALHSTERFLHFYILSLLEREEKIIGGVLEDGVSGDDETLMETARKLYAASHRNRRWKLQKRAMSRRKWSQNGPRGGCMGIQYVSQSSSSDVNTQSPGLTPPPMVPRPHGGLGYLHSKAPQQSGVWGVQHVGDNSDSFFSSSRGSLNPNRSAEESLLFRLIITLQLCQVRIEDTDKSICGRKWAKERSKLLSKELKCAILGTGEQSNGDLWQNKFAKVTPATNAHRRRENILVAGFIGTGTALLLGHKYKSEDKRHSSNLISGKALIATGTLKLLHRGWMHLSMNARLSHSIISLEDWQHQWVLVQSVGSSLLAGDDDEDCTATEGFVYQAGGDVINCRERLLQLIQFQNTSPQNLVSDFDSTLNKRSCCAKNPFYYLFLTR